MSELATILPAEFRVEPHPCLPQLTEEETAELLMRSDGLDAWLDYKRHHDEALRKAEVQPLDFGFEFPAWEMSDRDLAGTDTEILAAFGVNRGGKSWWAGKRFCEAARAYTGGVLIALSEKLESSIATQQQIVWHFLRNWIEPYNGKKHASVKVNYSQAGGFTEGKVVLPMPPGVPQGTDLGTEIYFLTYRQLAKDYEGWEFGARLRRRPDGSLSLIRRPDGSEIQNVGWWADESLTLAWLETLQRRAKFRASKGLWTFTPRYGMTPAIKEVLGPKPEVIESAKAELLPNAMIAGCPRGYMPLRVKPWRKGVRVVYFHFGSNPLSGYTEQVRDLVVGKNTEYIERIAYGYARDTIARACPKFGPWNIVEPSRLPADGTNYMITDPGVAKPFFTIWVRVSDGPEFWVYRDWPDEQSYGEWAVATERETTEDTRKGWDGDPGPGQIGLGLGYAAYKRLWLDLETIRPGAEEKDPYRFRIQQRLAAGEWAREEIWERVIDVRAANREVQLQNGNSTPAIEFAKSEIDPSTGHLIEGMDFRLSKGDAIDNGLTLVNGWLDWNMEQPMAPYTNSPRLWVSSNCRQVIWALNNYTGRAGQQGACKEAIDCLRYAATADLQSVESGALQPVGGGSY